MDTFMDKLAQRFTAQEMIKANSAADAEELDQLKEQVKVLYSRKSLCILYNSLVFFSLFL